MLMLLSHTLTTQGSRSKFVLILLSGLGNSVMDAQTDRKMEEFTISPLSFKKDGDNSYHLRSLYSIYNCPKL